MSQARDGAAVRLRPGGSTRADGTSAPTRPVVVRLTALELASLDAARGEETRSDFIRRKTLDGAAVPASASALIGAAVLPLPQGEPA